MEPDRWPARLFAQLHSLPQTQHRGLATLSHFLTFTWTWILIWTDSMKRQTKPQKAWWKFNFRMNELEIMWQNKGLWYLSFVTLAIAFLCSHLSALTRMLAMSVLTKRKETDGPSLDFLICLFQILIFGIPRFQFDFSVFAATAPVFNDGCVSVSWEGRRKWSFIWIWHPELPNSCPTKSALIWRTGQKVTLHVCLFRAGRSGQLEMWVVLDSGGKHVTFYNPGISAGNVRISSKAIYAF